MNSVVFACIFRVQEQENQKQQLREELDRLKAPLDSREASSQTPDHLQQVLRLIKQLLSLPAHASAYVGFKTHDGFRFSLGQNRNKDFLRDSADHRWILLQSHYKMLGALCVGGKCGL